MSMKKRLLTLEMRKFASFFPNNLPELAPLSRMWLNNLAYSLVNAGD